jgi:CBS domain-containing protein
MHMQIRDVMTPDLDVVTPVDTLRTAARLMAELDCEALPVAEENRLAGVVTGRDIGVRVVAEGCNPKEVTVGEAMAPDPLYCFEDEPIQAVAEKMAQWWVRRLPVVNRDKRLIGVVSLADLAGAEAASQAPNASIHSDSPRPTRSVWQTRQVHKPTSRPEVAGKRTRALA